MLIIEKNCTYCGEEKATTQIFNPNFNEEEAFWDVCITCKKLIEQQQNKSFGFILKNFEKRNNLKTEFPDKIIKKSSEEIQKLSYESGKEVFGVVIKRKNKEKERNKLAGKDLI